MRGTGAPAHLRPTDEARVSDHHEPGERVLTEPQRAYLEGWLRDVGDRLGLRDWTITASAYVAKDDAMASTFIRNSSDEMEVAVARDFPTRPPASQRATLIHELLHPHFHRLTQLSRNLVENELGRRTEAVIDAAIEFHEELTIERLAKAIAGFYPAVELPLGAVTPEQPPTSPLAQGGTEVHHA